MTDRISEEVLRKPSKKFVCEFQLYQKNKVVLNVVSKIILVIVLVIVLL